MSRLKFCKRLALVAAAVYGVHAEALWAAETAGTTGFSFLNIPAGARATAMGQAFTAVPNDVQGLSYNPATLATLIAHQFSFQHLSYVEGVTQEAFAYGHTGRQETFSWGLSANYLRVGGITRTVATGDASGDGYTEEGDFSTYDMALGATAAAPLGENVVMGATLKMLRESLADASSNGAAFDLGAMYQSSSQHLWNAGAALQNVGIASRFADAAVKLPTTLRLGFSGQPFAQWLFSADYIRRQDTKGELDAGAEITPKRPISLRLGYRYQIARPDLGTLSEFSIGFGIRHNQMSLDYAFVPLGDLGMTHWISFNYRIKARRD